VVNIWPVLATGGAGAVHTAARASLGGGSHGRIRNDAALNWTWMHLSHLITSSCLLDTQGCPTNLDLKNVKNNIRRVSQL